MTLLRAALAALIVILASQTAVAQSARTLEDLSARAEEGVAEAQFSLGMRFQTGEGVLQNHARAAEWFFRAAEQGHAPAQNQLGRYYHSGLGVPRDRATALRWLEAAAATGTADFVFDLASVLESGPEGQVDAARAAALYMQAASAGHLEATVSLGVLYQNGIGVPADPEQARVLYEAAAQQGHARALNNLGLLYVRGNGVEQDYARAVALFTEASERGLGEAMTNLGVMYANGFGVPVDEARAEELYRMGGRSGGDPVAPADPSLAYDPRLAAPDTSEAGLTRLRRGVAAGDPVARFQAAWLMLSREALSPGEQVEGARLMQAAAEAGLPPAMFNLALLYFEGRGVHQDYVLSRMWLLRAAHAGQPDPADLSARLAAKMTPSQINEAQERAARGSERHP